MDEELWLRYLEEKLKKQKEMEEYLTQGINNTRWKGTKAGYVDLLRKGLKVTEIELVEHVDGTVDITGHGLGFKPLTDEVFDRVVNRQDLS